MCVGVCVGECVGVDMCVGMCRCVCMLSLEHLFTYNNKDPLLVRYPLKCPPPDMTTLDMPPAVMLPHLADVHALPGT